jgi:hypothetical protein
MNGPVTVHRLPPNSAFLPNKETAIRGGEEQ